MTSVTMHEAKTNLSKLVALVENGEEESIVISRGNTPAAILVPYEEPDTSKRLGIAEELFDVPDNIDECNHEIEELFESSH